LGRRRPPPKVPDFCRERRNFLPQNSSAALGRIPPVPPTRTQNHRKIIRGNRTVRAIYHYLGIAQGEEKSSPRGGARWLARCTRRSLSQARSVPLLYSSGFVQILFYGVLVITSSSIFYGDSSSSSAVLCGRAAAASPASERGGPD
jgi:hypothetical protein